MSLCMEGNIALLSFTAFAVLSWYQARIIFMDYWSYKYCLATYGSAVCTTFLLPYSDIVKRAALIGSVFGSSLILSMYISSPWMWIFIYGIFLSFFHFSEYHVTALYNPDKLSTDSFLLNHSPEYQIAAVASWVEFILEAYYFPSMKTISVINVTGLGLVIIGELLRKFAMVTAKSNFSHVVQDERDQEHKLVTNGLYAYMRHPSYVGWFWWSIGTQLLLCNPVCLIGYVYASWRFFYERIRVEEYHLIQFFQQDYIDYIGKVRTGLPFISGLEEEVRPLLTRSS